MMDGQPSFLGAYLSSLAPILHREDLVKIGINPDGRVWIERKGGSQMELVPDLQIDRSRSVNLGQAIASSVGVQFSDKKPTVSGKITWGATAIRAQAVAPPMVEGGMAITLRPFKLAVDAPIKSTLLHESLIDLDHRKRELGKEVLALAEAGDVESAMRLCVRKRLNVLISGGTSTGKTTFARSFTTIHADTARKAIDRLAIMVMAAGLGMGFEEV